MKVKRVQDQEAAPFGIGGVFKIKHIRNGKVIDEWEEKNLVVDEGLNNLLDVYLHGSAQDLTWHVGIFEGNYTPVNTDDAANIATNATECSAYTESTRPAWEEAAAAGKTISNSANKATFTINDTKTIYGAFLISEGTKGGAAGVLFAASKFSTSRSVVTDDQLLITYSVSAASA